MKNLFKNIKNWNSTLKVGSVIALGGAIIVGTSLIYASREPTSSSSSSIDIVTPSTSEDPVDNKVEEILRPYTVDCEVAHYFYDKTDNDDIREKSIVLVPSSSRTYIKSEGCDYTYNNSDFEVVASVSGTITEKMTDKIYGELVVLTHENGTKFIYSSLNDVKVNKGQNVKQGDVIALSGTSNYTENIGKSLHFEIIKEDTKLNPEKTYTKSIESL